MDTARFLSQMERAYDVKLPSRYRTFLTKNQDRAHAVLHLEDGFVRGIFALDFRTSALVSPRKLGEVQQIHDMGDVEWKGDALRGIVPIASPKVYGAASYDEPPKGFIAMDTETTAVIYWDYDGWSHYPLADSLDDFLAGKPPRKREHRAYKAFAWLSKKQADAVLAEDEREEEARQPEVAKANAPLRWKVVTTKAEDPLFCSTTCAWDGGVAIVTPYGLQVFTVKTGNPKRLLAESPAMEWFCKGEEPIQYVTVPSADALFVVGQWGTVARLDKGGKRWEREHAAEPKLALTSTHSAVYDPVGDRILCFGVRGPRSWEPALWVYERAAKRWRKSTSGSKPPTEWNGNKARGDYSLVNAVEIDYQLVHDPDRCRVLRFGAKEVAVLDGRERWQPIADNLPEIPRHDRHVAYDPKSHCIYLWDFDKRVIYAWRDDHCELVGRMMKPPLPNNPPDRTHYDPVTRRLIGVDFEKGRIAALAMP